MLIYLSSYPRSGNTWVRQLIRHYFDRRTSSLYFESNGLSNLVQHANGTFGSPFDKYQTQYAPIQTHLRLVNDCGYVLDEKLRRKVAAADEHFFLKTHERPYTRYFEGECVIHLVRHPAAVMWSYYNYIRDNEPALANGVTIEDVIEGNVFFGSWSEYNEQWLHCADALRERFILYSYEQLAEGECELCDHVSTLTQLPIRREFGSFPQFDHWRREVPQLYRGGKIDEWRTHLDRSHLQRITQLHGAMLEKLSYGLEEFASEKVPDANK